jgi:hypothetical protein
MGKVGEILVVTRSAAVHDGVGDHVGDSTAAARARGSLWVTIACSSATRNR